MKNKLLTLTLLLLTFSSTAQNGKQNIKIGAESIIKAYKLNYEHSLSKRLSVNGSIKIRPKNKVFERYSPRPSEFASNTHYRIDTRYFLSKKRELLEGFYTGAFLGSRKFKRYNVDTGGDGKDGQNETTTRKGGGIEFGFQEIADSQFVVDLNVGVGYANFKVNHDSYSQDYNEVFPHGNVLIGYNF